MWEVVNARLALTGSRAAPAPLAAFAPDILCLDETRLDAVGRYLKPLRGLSAHDPACTAFKLVGLFDLRGKPMAATGMARGGAARTAEWICWTRLPRTLSGEFAALRSGLFQLQLLGYLDPVETVVGEPLSGEHVLPHRACILSATREEGCSGLVSGGCLGHLATLACIDTQ